MMESSNYWTTCSPSRYPWEREALDLIQQWMPKREPYHAWSNFEFIADDGSINEVDLLISTPQGLFLVEIKSQPGRLTGDAATWNWHDPDGRIHTTDNPLIAANTKAKKLQSLLSRTRSARQAKLPYIEPLVFCSAANLQCDLSDRARARVCLRDRAAAGDQPSRPGILAALGQRQGPGLDARPRGAADRPLLRTLSQAMQDAGIRPSKRSRRVADYVLEHLLDQGAGYQDWQASHVQLPNVRRRVRVYLVRIAATKEERQTIERAAQREYQLLLAVEHPGILRAELFTECDLGPAIVFEHPSGCQRFDHFLAQHRDRLSTDDRLNLLRELAEIVRYAHDKRTVHRALCPQNILVTDPESARPRLKVFNWHTGYRNPSSSTSQSAGVLATEHLEQLLEPPSLVYLAPEAFTDPNSQGEHLDIFSLGAIAFQLFSSQPPAADRLDLNDKLRQFQGLSLSAVVNGVTEHLDWLIQFSTCPDVSARLNSAADFLSELTKVEDELTSPDRDAVENPAEANRGDRLAGGFTVQQRLGSGATSVALLVEKAGESYVLKVARDPEHNSRVQAEAKVLELLRHQHIVALCDELSIGSHDCLLLRRAGEKTLGQRLREDGRLNLDLLQRFGDDLLGVVNYLEEQGIPHRDIKPDNIGVGSAGSGQRLHLVLFDFSLASTPAENITAGTPGYLDPFLQQRKRWDFHAERYAAAVTLYEMATGILPRWGDGRSDPALVNCEATIEAELLDPVLREPLGEFFRRALRREASQRFDNAEEILRAWREAFSSLDEAEPAADSIDSDRTGGLLDTAQLDSHIAELGLSTRATNVLDRANILTVDELLRVPVGRLMRLRGVGNKTRTEIVQTVRLLRERLGHQETAEPDRAAIDAPDAAPDQGPLSVDLIVERLLQALPKGQQKAAHDAVRVFLGLEEIGEPLWPTQTAVADHLQLTRARIGQTLNAALQKWLKHTALTELREQVVDLVSKHGGVLTANELRDAVLVARGSMHDAPLRLRHATAAARAAVEVERISAEGRLALRRDGHQVLVATDAALADYASRLGGLADKLAQEEPLLPPARVLERLEDLAKPPEAAAITAVRLVRLAAAASQNAALSSRQELYPRGLDPARALRLAQGALVGLKGLTPEELRQRVQSRYPEAAPLPARPALDSVLAEAGLELRWDVVAGKYFSPQHETVSVTTGTAATQRQPTSLGPMSPDEITPEIAEARRFEDRLLRAHRAGHYLLLLANLPQYQQAQAELCRRFDVERVDCEGVLLAALQQAAATAHVDWNLVVETDALPGGPDWSKLLILVDRAMPVLEQTVLAAGRPVLLVYPGLLARYGQLEWLDRLRERVGERDGVPGLWVLLPANREGKLGGRVFATPTPAERVEVPDSWVQNLHRAALAQKESA